MVWLLIVVDVWRLNSVCDDVARWRFHSCARWYQGGGRTVFAVVVSRWPYQGGDLGSMLVAWGGCMVAMLVVVVAVVVCIGLCV